MAAFKVVKVDSTIAPVPAWVPQQLAAAGIDFTAYLCQTREEFARHTADADLVWLWGAPLPGDYIRTLPRCGAILRTGAGTDNVDVAAATELGIIVANTPHPMTEPVADHTIALLLALMRHVVYLDKQVRQGRWLTPLELLPRRNLTGATVGLVAFGLIGRNVARKLSGFDVSVLVYDPYVAPDVVAEHGARQVARLSDLLAAADFVSVHSPYLPETYHLIGEAEFRQMQRHALFVNTARGKVVDEAALIRALQEGWIAGAALDVLEEEPIAPDNPLLAMDNVILTPHYAGYGHRFPEDSYEASVEAIIALARRQWPRSVVNRRTVRPRWGALA